MKNFTQNFIGLFVLVFAMNFTVNAQEGCMISSACNYNSDATEMSNFSVCDFSCYGCLDQSACNYNAEATTEMNNEVVWGVQDEMYSLGLEPWSVDFSSLYSSSCVFSDQVLQGLFDDDCDCVMDYNENFTLSSAFFPTGSGTHNLVPWTCSGFAIASNNTGSATLNVVYPCDAYRGAYTNLTGSGQVNITIPSSMQTFTLTASTGSTSFNVYYNSASTTIANNTNTSGSVNFIETSESELMSLTSCLNPNLYGCTDENALNYNSAANIDNNTCIVRVNGCTEENAYNYNPSANSDDSSCIGGFLELPKGWSMFGHTCLDSVDAEVGFADISDKIDIVKDEQGLSYIPSWEFNAMGSLKFSEGYQIKMKEAVKDFQFCETTAPEDGITQADVDFAVAAITPEDGISQADLDALSESYEGYTAPVDLQIGDHHMGGIVFQINENGSGLVAAKEDLPGYYDWKTALDEASNYSIDGYSGWHLPSKEELQLMYNTIGPGLLNSLENIGGFKTSADNDNPYAKRYWASSIEISHNTYADGASYITLYYNISTSMTVGALSSVRVVRAF